MISEIIYSSPDEDVDYKFHSKYCVHWCNQHPDEVCFIGKCILYAQKGEYDDNCYMSNVLANPTYNNVFLLCDKIVEATQDFEHIFLKLYLTPNK